MKHTDLRELTNLGNDIRKTLIHLGLKTIKIKNHWIDIDTQIEMFLYDEKAAVYNASIIFWDDKRSRLSFPAEMSKTDLESILKELQTKAKKEKK